MAVKEILDDRVIDLNMNAKNKDEVIRHLAGLLKNAGYIENLEGYVRDVYVRESEGITGIGGHVAIPHGKSDHVDRVGIAVGRTRDMIDWESYDGEPSRLFSSLLSRPTVTAPRTTCASLQNWPGNWEMTIP